MLQIHELTKSYSAKVLFEDVTLQMGSGERLGLVGRNGHGKSTLFKLILNQEVADSGRISTPKNYQIGHLAQHLVFTKPTILEESALGLPEDEKDSLYKVESILFGLGFTKADMDRAPSEFSGGYQIRLNLAKVLVSDPNLLLLDEPTNYLDIVSIRWLTQFLRQWKNELIIISHDREFMDSVTTHTAMIHRNKIKKVQGNTTKLYEQIALEEEIYEKTRANDEKKRKDIESFVNRFRAQANKASLVQSRVKLLEKMPEAEKLARIAALDFSFKYAPTMAKVLVDVENFNFGYVPEKPIIKKFSITIKHGEKIAIIGKNGKGKSTLLNLLAGELTANSGEIKNHSSLQTGLFGQTNISRLSPNLTVEEEINSADSMLSKTAVRNICGTMMFTSDDALKKVSVLSGGEKSRVLLGKMLVKPSNLLFLDEPTNHLDMDSIASLLEALQAFTGTVILVTHNEMILRNLAERFIVFQDDGQMVFDGDYEDFLSKVGWESEIPESKKKMNKKDSAQMRAETIQARSKVLNPLKYKIEKIENDIHHLEVKINELNAAILRASEEGQTQKIAGFAMEIKSAERTIEELFYSLEESTISYDRESKHFASLLE